MKLSMDMDLEQKQEMVMTPRLQMAIEILQLNSQELNELIYEKYLENPFLDQEEKTFEERMDSHAGAGSAHSNSNIRGGEREQFKKFVPHEPQFYEYMMSQIKEVLTGQDLDIGRYIIGNLEETGLLKMNNEELAQNLGYSRERIKKVRKKIMHIDPPGLAAPNSRKAMSVQLKKINCDDLAELILEKSYNELADLTLKQFCQSFNTEKEEAVNALQKLKQLNPHPASGHRQKYKKEEYIEPDVILKKVDGEYIVKLNQGKSPALTINTRYYRMMRRQQDEEVSEYLKNKFSSALWLIKAVERRKLTLTKISRLIAKNQREFLQKGIKYLRPLTMREIAEQADVHESTVSRAVKDKYIQTERGMYKLKFFFSEGVDDKAAPAIKAIISSYVDEENKPLSDRALTEKLQEDYDIDLSRRTLAKYRNAMGIPSSVKRRKWYNKV